MEGRTLAQTLDRWGFGRESMCQPGEGRLDQVWWLARITDISTTGIALVLQQLRQKFPAGTLLTVELQNWAGDVSRTLQTRVVHMTPHPEGGWIMGCAFVTPLTPVARFVTFEMAPLATSIR